MQDDGDVDYSRYTVEELEEALAGIDREKYPRNYQNLRIAYECLTTRLARVAEPATSTEGDDASDAGVASRDALATRLLAVVAGAFCIWWAYDIFGQVEACPEGRKLVGVMVNAICEKFGHGVAASIPFALGLAMVFYSVRQRRSDAS
jgi:hypothetical protein